MGEGALRCSLYLSPNVLADSLMYSSLQSSLSHLNRYIMPLFVVWHPCLRRYKCILDGSAALEVGVAAILPHVFFMYLYPYISGSTIPP